MAVLERNRAATDTPDHLAVMRGDDHGRPARVHLAKQIHDFERQVRIEIAGRLVRQHDLRIVDEGAGNGDALLLAAGELFGMSIHPVLQADPFQHLKGLALLCSERQAKHAHDECDVLKHSESRNQAEVLKNESNRSAVGLHLRSAEIAEVAAADLQQTLGWQLLPEQQAKQRGLTRAARPCEKQKFTLVDRQREVAQRIDAAPVHLREVRALDHACVQLIVLKL